MTIHVITEPKIVVIGKQYVCEEAVKEFLTYNNLGEWFEDEPGTDGERLAEFGGRICYSAFGKKQGRRTNQEYLANILNEAHGSVLEHGVWTFAISGVSRSLTHELIRHRVGMSPSELSQRYVDLEDVQFVLPPDIEFCTSMYDLWETACGSALESYNQLAEALMIKFKQEYPHMELRDRRKHARQAARSVLPNCTETHIVLTANARALRHIIQLRGAEGAEIEIRRFAGYLLEIMQFEAPNLFGGFQLSKGFDSVLVVDKGR